MDDKYLLDYGKCTATPNPKDCAFCITKIEGGDLIDSWRCSSHCGEGTATGFENEVIESENDLRDTITLHNRRVSVIDPQVVSPTPTLWTQLDDTTPIDVTEVGPRSVVGAKREWKKAMQDGTWTGQATDHGEAKQVIIQLGIMGNTGSNFPKFLDQRSGIMIDLGTGEAYEHGRGLSYGHSGEFGDCCMHLKGCKTCEEWTHPVGPIVSGVIPVQGLLQCSAVVYTFKSKSEGWETPRYVYIHHSMSSAGHRLPQEVLEHMKTSFKWNVPEFRDADPQVYLQGGTVYPDIASYRDTEIGMGVQLTELYEDLAGVFQIEDAQERVHVMTPEGMPNAYVLIAAADGISSLGWTAS